MNFEKIPDKEITNPETEKENIENFRLKESAIFAVLTELMGEPKFDEPKYIDALKNVIKILKVEAEFARNGKIFPFGHTELKSKDINEIKNRLDKIFWEKAAFIEASNVSKKLAEAVKENKNYLGGQDWRIC